MDVVLAILMLGAVILFGALISLGNERQRKALDGIREQTALWAMQDLRMKREKLAREVRVDDPLGWLNKIVSKVVGRDFHLKVVESFDIPPILVCESEERSSKVVFTPLSPSDIRRLKSGRRNRLSQYANQNPLFSLAGNTPSYELTILNAGILFDLEVALVWKAFTADDLGGQSLWMFLIE
jgi:hypothetical protein